MKSRFSRFTLIIALLLAPLAVLHAADLGGVKVTLNGNQGPAVVTAELTEKFKLGVHVAANGETKPLAVRVELPNAGPNVWPAADVEVRDATGKSLLVQRTGNVLSPVWLWQGAAAISMMALLSRPPRQS